MIGSVVTKRLQDLLAVCDGNRCRAAKADGAELTNIKSDTENADNKAKRDDGDSKAS
ncbi:MAG: hypothetical protein QOE70_5340 [Chthoniobacter sp.]|jgi:hypothetical protein|nr:hypothetical protein [Chthoniobacter sp.]